MEINDEGKLLHIVTEQDDTVVIDLEDCQICIKHNDIGISIDFYRNNGQELVEEKVMYFKDYQ